MLNKLQRAVSRHFAQPIRVVPGRKTLILAGSYQHACFCADNLLKLKRCEWKYVNSIEQIFGIRDADIWMYQTWLDKWRGDDLNHIVARLNSMKYYCNINHINEYGRTFPVC